MSGRQLNSRMPRTFVSRVCWSKNGFAVSLESNLAIDAILNPDSPKLHWGKLFRSSSAPSLEMCFVETKPQVARQPRSSFPSSRSSTRTNRSRRSSSTSQQRNRNFEKKSRLPAPRARSSSPSSEPNRFENTNSSKFPPALAAMPFSSNMFQDGRGKIKSQKSMSSEGTMADHLLYMFSHETKGKFVVDNPAGLIESKVADLSERMKGAFLDVLRHGRNATSWPLIWDCSFGIEDGRVCQPPQNDFLKGFDIVVLNPKTQNMNCFDFLKNSKDPLFVDTESLYHGELAPGRERKDMISKKGQPTYEKVALIQFADLKKKEVVLIRVHQLSLEELQEVYEKIALIRKKRKIFSFGSEGLGSGIIDIQPYTTEEGYQKNKMSLVNCVKELFDGMVVEKHERMSNWGAPVLRTSQIFYAALDAVLVGEIFMKMPKKQQ